MRELLIRPAPINLLNHPEQFGAKLRRIGWLDPRSHGREQPNTRDVVRGILALIVYRIENRLLNGPVGGTV
jgi:hypothetical protein